MQMEACSVSCRRRTESGSRICSTRPWRSTRRWVEPLPHQARPAALNQHNDSQESREEAA
jgi:hypothetical protein